jgi:hypothetical protein
MRNEKIMQQMNQIKGTLDDRCYSESQDIHKIILEWILGKYGGRMWTGFNWLKIKTSAWFL